MEPEKFRWQLCPASAPGAQLGIAPVGEPSPPNQHAYSANYRFAILSTAVLGEPSAAPPPGLLRVRITVSLGSLRLS
jgi:hypothetical protein